MVDIKSVLFGAGMTFALVVLAFVVIASINAANSPRLPDPAATYTAPQSPTTR